MFSEVQALSSLFYHSVALFPLYFLSSFLEIQQEFLLGT